VGDGVWRRRFESWDLNIGVVRGSDALLIVDTRESHRRAQELRDEIRSLTALPVRWVVNTHWHFDHTFGNFVLASPPDQAELWGHETVPGLLAAHGDSVRRRIADDGLELAVDMAEVVVTPPDHLVGPRASLDLGDRSVELHHLGRGHTDGDLVVIAPDARVVFAGDLVEESAPPYFGPDSFPLDWPATLAALLDVVGSESIVPGHGDVVDRAFCADQHTALVAVDALIRDLHAAAVPVEDALREGEDRWPWPAAALDDAVRRGYLALDGGDLDPKLT
jgi:glyoxylase-like metal-dependent hydrolase (beta-lactamase superfamily II)